MFCTVLNYICMRMLGEGRDGGKDKACERARKWILDHGSAIAISSWGKTWLAVQHMIQHNSIKFHTVKLVIGCWFVSLVECVLSSKKNERNLYPGLHFVSNCLIFLCCRYLVCMSGLDAIQCPQNFGSCHIHLPFIQVCILFYEVDEAWNLYINIRNPSIILAYDCWKLQILELVLNLSLRNFFESCQLHSFWNSVLNLNLVACVKPAFSSAVPIMHFINAGNLLGYCRLTYLPMAYLYGKRFVGPITPLILQIREEIYNEPYEKLNWRRVRHLCAKVSWLLAADLQKMIWKHLIFFKICFISSGG